MKSSSETEFYHNGPKPFKKVLKPVNPFFCFGSHSEKKKLCKTLLWNRNLVFQCCKSPAFWLGCCWEKNSVYSRMTVQGLLSPLERSTRLPNTGVTAATVLQVLTFSSTSSLDFVIWGPPNLLVTRDDCVPLPRACKPSPSIHCHPVPTFRSCSPLVSLIDLFTIHIHHHLPTLQM